MKLIIAGNIQQAKLYAHDNNIERHEWIYADNEDRIRGLRGVEIIRAGSYWENPIVESDRLKEIEGR